MMMKTDESRLLAGEFTSNFTPLKSKFIHVRSQYPAQKQGGADREAPVAGPFRVFPGKLSVFLLEIRLL